MRSKKERNQGEKPSITGFIQICVRPIPYGPLSPLVLEDDHGKSHYEDGNSLNHAKSSQVVRESLARICKGV